MTRFDLPRATCILTGNRNSRQLSRISFNSIEALFLSIPKTSLESLRRVSTEIDGGAIDQAFELRRNVALARELFLDGLGSRAPSAGRIFLDRPLLFLSRGAGVVPRNQVRDQRARQQV